LTDLPNNHDDGNQSGGGAFDTTVIDILEGRLLLEQLRPKTGGDPPPPTQAKKREPRRGAKFTALADVRPQPVRWLWPDRIACKLVLFTGLPDCGKTTAAIDIAARVTMGKVWPDGSGLAPHGSVLILTAEDGLADTIRTRADAAGADVWRIYVLTGVHDERGNQSSFELQQDLVLLAEKVQEVGDVALVIIDPITAYMGAGKIDTHKTADVRAVLSPLRDFADRHGVAVIGLTHPSKSVNKAMNAATGSQAFVAASRATWLFARETDEEGQETGRMLMLPVKNNLSAKRNNGLAYRLAGRDLGNGMSAPYVQWEDDPVTITADQALAMAMEAGSFSDEGRTADVADFLREVLKDGPVPVAEIEASARSAGLLGATQRVNQSKPFRKAKEKLGIEAYQPQGEQSGTGSPGWVWFLRTNSQ
jgi:putative DNA primase/helicase